MTSAKRIDSTAEETGTEPTAVTPKASLDRQYVEKLHPLVGSAPWVLRITEWKTKPPPLFIIRQRRSVEDPGDTAGRQPAFRDRGLLHGESQRRCLPTLRMVLSRVHDRSDQPLELQQYLTRGGLSFRGNLPLDEEAGTKLALVFKLQERVKELDRVELIARRVDRFTAEEAAYWLSRISNFGTDANRWAVSGMKILLGGHPHDPAVSRMLDQLRTRY